MDYWSIISGFIKDYGIIVTIAIAMGAYYLAYPTYKINKEKKQREKSENEFINIRDYLRENRAKLEKIAYKYYKKDYLINNVPLISQKEWLPDKPILLSELELEKIYSSTDLDNIDHIGWDKILPYSNNGKRFKNYAEAINELDKPSMFINRESFRLLNVGQKNGSPYMAFSLCKYFDHINMGEALSYELARNEFLQLGSKLNIRKKIKDPFDHFNRFVIPGICTLTIRKEGDKSTFYMLLRHKNHVATGMNNYHVIPSGEFQPSSKSPESIRQDYDIWKNIMREYNEEFLGAKEACGDIGWATDYDSEPFISFNQARDSGMVKCYYLGYGIDPLNLKGEILTVCIWNSEVFDTVFKDSPWSSEEGQVIAGDRHNALVSGISFTQDNINKFLYEWDCIPAALACLVLTWKFRKELNLE